MSVSGNGGGTVTSSPGGITCGNTCSASFDSGTKVTLTAAPASGWIFKGWSGACSGTSTCTLNVTANVSAAAAFAKQGTLQSSINHIVFMLQENRGFDHYFGAMRQYWADNGYKDVKFDGLPQFPTSSPTGDPPAIPGCDPNFPFPGNLCLTDSDSPSIASYHLQTMCLENPSPSWNESHVDFNKSDSGSNTPTLDGYVRTAANDARQVVPPYHDTDGIRAMGYYTGDDLPYYYFMASNFATSDSWYSPEMTRTQPNRMYLLSGTSAGHAYPLDPNGDIQQRLGLKVVVPRGTSGGPLSNKTIFQLLDEHNISWKIYVTDYINGIPDTFISMFTYGQEAHPNIVPVAQYFTDVAKGTLPQVAMIEGGYSSGTDEHPAVLKDVPAGNVQVGSKYVSTLINALMGSPSWKDSVFILSFDEFGGFYDHVAPQPMPSPDGISPIDLQPGDICTAGKGEGNDVCNFKYTGYRLPLIVVSPFTKQHYVSHTVADYTAILKLIETRFDLPSLTARDAAQMDMTEFFDFNNPAWLTPPNPPEQPTDKPCYLDHLP